jgi:hypothetical protein
MCTDKWRLMLANGLFKIIQCGWHAVPTSCTPLGCDITLGLINPLSILNCLRFWWVDDKTMQVNDRHFFRSAIQPTARVCGSIICPVSGLCGTLSAVHSVYHTQVRIAVHQFGDWFSWRCTSFLRLCIEDCRVNRNLWQQCSYLVFWTYSFGTYNYILYLEM